MREAQEANGRTLVHENVHTGVLNFVRVRTAAAGRHLLCFGTAVALKARET